MLSPMLVGSEALCMCAKLTGESLKLVHGYGGGGNGGGGWWYELLIPGNKSAQARKFLFEMNLSPFPVIFLLK
jgi:hypothetical protein